MFCLELHNPGKSYVINWKVGGKASQYISKERSSLGTWMAVIKEGSEEEAKGKAPLLLSCLGNPMLGSS